MSWYELGRYVLCCSLPFGRILYSLSKRDVLCFTAKVLRFLCCFWKHVFCVPALYVLAHQYCSVLGLLFPGQAKALASFSEARRSSCREGVKALVLCVCVKVAPFWIFCHDLPSSCLYRQKTKLRIWLATVTYCGGPFFLIGQRLVWHGRHTLVNGQLTVHP